MSVNKLSILFCALLCSVGTVQAKMSHDKHHGPSSAQPKECLTPGVMPSVHCGKTPTAIFSTNGTLYVVFSQHGHVYLTTSSDKGKTFNPSIAVNRIPEAIYDNGENRPKIILGKDKQIYISWTHKTPGRYSGDVRFSRSMDNGQTFDTPITINSDRALISHRFESMSLDGKGRVYLIWIDKRDREKAKKNQQTYAGVSLYHAVSEDFGKSFKPNQKLVDHSCDKRR